MYDCLQNIIGLIGVDNDCLPELDVNESLSGLYVDDTTAGHIPLKASFWTDYDRIDRIIPDAINEAVKQTRQTIDKRLTRNFRTHNAKIGYKDDYTNFIQATDGYYMLSIMPKKINGGIIRINTIDIWTINGKHTGNLHVVQDGEATTTTSLNWQAKNYHSESNIYIMYQGDRPRDFLHNGCCGKGSTYSGWARVGGGILASMNDAEFLESNYCYGVELNVTFDCNGFSESMFDSLDYQNSNFGYAFASLVQLIARKNIAYNVLTSDVITPYLITSIDEVKGIITYLTAEIEITLNYLKESYGHSDCYRCNGIYKGEILI
ncbi:MAG: hypothetical protein WAT92_00330 [Saprospiraceae bacterium]